MLAKLLPTFASMLWSLIALNKLCAPLVVEALLNTPESSVGKIAATALPAKESFMPNNDSALEISTGASVYLAMSSKLIDMVVSFSKIRKVFELAAVRMLTRL